MSDRSGTCLTACLLAASTLGLAGGGLLGFAAEPARAQVSDTARRCEALQGFEADGLEITSARLVPAAAPGTVRRNAFTEDTFDFAFPEHCRIEGVINRRQGAGGVEYGIGFALTLPTDWQGRLLFQGGGGFNGSIREPYGPTPNPQDAALAHGFAVVSTDGGHKGSSFDVAFMADQQAALDFVFNALPTVTLTAKAIATAYYDEAPHHTYSVGCSTGGREGMLAAQRYPLLFDGVVSGHPAIRTAHSRLAAFNAVTAFNRIAPRNPDGTPRRLEAFPAGDQRLLHRAIAAQCDALDGLADGMIFNLRACNFDPRVLQCRGEKTDQCLSAGQVEALRTAFAGPRDSRGNPVYASFPYDLGLLGEHVGNKSMSMLPISSPGPFDTPRDPFSIDVDAEIARIASDALQILSDTHTWTDLGSFYRKGGKIIFYHGAADPWFSVNDTIAYYEANKTANPEFDSSRLYAIPGLAHCGEGPLEVFDLLTPLVDWVERGKAPLSVVAQDWLGTRTRRPLCPWPQYPRYDGDGDPNDPANFACTN